VDDSSAAAFGAGMIGTTYTLGTPSATGVVQAVASAGEALVGTVSTLLDPLPPPLALYDDEVSAQAVPTVLAYTLVVAESASETVGSC
jgi:hypothetical protein